MDQPWQTNRHNIGRRLRTGPPLIMGILNITPDSFSDGGAWTDPDQALQQARRLVAEGADILDIGGESSRPGAVRVDAAVQQERVLPVIQLIREAMPEVAISIDTTSAEVAAASGADWINDISAGQEDPDICALAADRGLPVVLMHMQGVPATMQQRPHYDDVTAEVLQFLSERAAIAEKAGMRPECILIDPGIGFGKTKAHNMELLTHLQQFTELPYPVLLGTSRKGFMRTLCGASKPDRLVGATCATTALGTLNGVRVFRVHDVAPNRQAATIAWNLIADHHAPA